MKRGARFITVALTSTVLVGAFLAAAAGSGGRGCLRGASGRKPTIVGTNKADVLKGTAMADVIVGLGGNDKIKALNGDDLICGARATTSFMVAWADLCPGEVGNDQLFGEAGPDNLWGQAGNDAFNGGPGFDSRSSGTLQNGVDVDLLAGKATGEGTDKLIGIEGVSEATSMTDAHRRHGAEPVRRTAG